MLIVGVIVIIAVLFIAASSPAGAGVASDPFIDGVSANQREPDRPVYSGHRSGATFDPTGDDARHIRLRQGNVQQAQHDLLRHQRDLEAQYYEARRQTSNGVTIDNIIPKEDFLSPEDLQKEKDLMKSYVDARQALEMAARPNYRSPLAGRRG